jgi:CelD/BcsL family acetyltransferase involved in cellulose biosynthesis
MLLAEPNLRHATQIRFLCREQLNQVDPQQWDDLAQAAAEPNVFLERWFVKASLDHLPCPPTLRIAAVEEDGQLIGVMLLFMARRYGRLLISHVQSWSHYHSFLPSPLVRAGHEAAFWQALLRAVDQEDWADGLFHASGLIEGGPVHSGLIAAARSLGRECDIVHRSERALLAAGLASTAYYETHVRKKKRKEIGRLRSRLAELGPVEHKIATTPEEVKHFAAEFLALEAAGWKGQAGSALLCTERTKRFFEAAVDGAFAANRLAFHRLSLDGKPIAMLVNFIAMPGAFSYKIAFDEAHARFSPGVLIQLENLVVLDQPGFGWMDSCAVEDHPMINSLWAERRSIIRVTLPLGGLKRGMIFRFCRTAEESWAQIKKLKKIGSAPAALLRKEADNDQHASF